MLGLQIGGIVKLRNVIRTHWLEGFSLFDPVTFLSVSDSQTGVTFEPCLLSTLLFSLLYLHTPLSPLIGYFDEQNQICEQ